MTQPDADLPKLLDGIVAFVRRFVVLSEAQAHVLALWVLHTWAIEAFDDTPFLHVTSAEPESGKTRVLEVLELLVRRPWKVVLPSEAVLYRKVSADKPTLLVDEVDAVFGPKAGEHEGLRALLNAGNRRGTKVPRCVRKGEELREFDVFGARALAGIGRLPDTVASRSIPLRLKRRAPGEIVEPFRRRDVEPEGRSLGNSLSARAEASSSALRAAPRPSFPASLRDRMADSCEPLLTIANTAGGKWPERARTALLKLCGGDDAGDDSLGVRVLRDCRSVFDARRGQKVPSADLCAALVGMEESPWSEFYKGRPLSVRGLARLLNPYNILPGSIRLDFEKTAKGYNPADFEDAWSRYLPFAASPPALSSGTTSQANTGAGFLDVPNLHADGTVTDEKREIVNTDRPCDGVTDGTLSSEGELSLDEGQPPVAQGAEEDQEAEVLL